MEIIEIQNKEVWESFLGQCQEKTFLQSWNWGEFQQKMGNRIWRLGVFDNEELVMVALVSKIIARRGTFLLIQHGPNFLNPNDKIQSSNQAQSSKSQILNTLLERLKKIAKEEKAVFARMNQLWEDNAENHDALKKLGLRKAAMHANAYEATWQLDIRPAEDEILAKMRKTTRYLIRLAQKNPDITIEKSIKSENIEIYQRLNKEVAKRQKFAAFSPEYIKNEFETFIEDGQTALFFGKYKGEVVCGALIIFWSNIAFYHQAASLEKFAKFSIPYLLQWEAIKEAKNKGCQVYDFWGYTDPQKYPRHPWAGPTLFKMGFGGGAKEYIETQDLPFSPKYWLTYAFEKIRKLKRGL